MRDAKSGIKPYLRGTCNPDPDSFVKKLIRWWLDESGRYADPEKSGVIRYIYRYNEETHYANTRQELMKKFDLKSHEVMSITFIPSSVYDNKVLIENNPEYISNLKAQNRVDRERLLKGDWLIKDSAGMYFRREWFKMAANPPPPSSFVRIIRAWDFAGTKKTDRNDPDATAGVLMGITDSSDIYVLDVFQDHLTPAEIERAVLNISSQDAAKYPNMEIRIPEDPGQAGKFQTSHFSKLLNQHYFQFLRPVTDKVTRAKQFSAQVEYGNVYLINADWNDKYINELQSFPEGNHDDMVDASSDSYNSLVNVDNETTTEEFLF